MGIQAINTVTPEANDLLISTLKVFANYNTPTQTLLGATRDGCKLLINRGIKGIGFDNAFGYTLDSDGVPLVRYEKLNGELTLNSLYLKYFNSKKISDCESDGNWESGDWSATGGTYAAETTIKNSGLQSAKCSIATTSTGHGIKEVFDSSIDLTVFDNAESSDTSDFIGFGVYITTAMLAILGTDSIQIRFHNDADETETNYLYYDIEASALTVDQWTNLKVLKSGFTAVGTGVWSGVTGISFQVPDETDDALEFYVDAISLIQDQSDSAIVPVNGGLFEYTDEGTYKRYTPSLDLSDENYLENITAIAYKADGKMFKFILNNAFSSSNLSLALEAMDEAVNDVTFEAHYNPNSIVCPIKIREYV